MRRREFIAGLGSAVAWPLTVRAQRSKMPVVGVAPDGSALYAAAFSKGLDQTGYVEGQNVTVEYRSFTGLADVVRCRVAVIVAAGILPRQRPKLRPRRSRSCSASLTTRSSLVLSPVSRGRA
jgi:putative ABC transport system substrate-binding protein